MRWLGNLFRRERAPEAEQWQVGDQAECTIVNFRWFGPCGVVAGPIHGQVRVVRVVDTGTAALDGETVVGLGFSDWPGEKYDARGFRKIRPRADALERGTAASVEDLRPAISPAELEDA